MYEIIIQICFVATGIITGCTDGYMTTDDPYLYLAESKVSPVYIYNAPKIITNHYHTHGYPMVSPHSHYRVRVKPRHHHVKQKIKVRPKPRVRKKLKVVIPPDLYRVKKHKKPKLKQHKKRRHQRRP